MEHPDAVTILLVDDEIALQQSVAELLQLQHYNVIVAGDGLQGLEAMQSQTPDLIISDIMMPKMDGLAFFEAVRSRPEWVGIPFIFLTARGQQQDIRLGTQLGADHYVVKPFDPDDLLVIVESRLKRAREIRRAAQTEIDWLKDRLLTVFSHEMRTPLTYIYGYLELLRDGYGELDSQMADWLLENAQRGAERIVKAVEDALMLIRIQAGLAELEAKLHSAPANLYELVQKAIGRLTPLAKQHRVSVELSAPEAIVAPCVAVYVSDAFTRVVENAIKYAKPDGGQVWVQVEEQEGQALITVRDNGIGMTQAELERAFIPFEQINREVMEQQGLGLGLTIAQGLIQAHGGKMWAQSEPGVGSTFYLALPLTDSRQA